MCRGIKSTLSASTVSSKDSSQTTDFTLHSQPKPVEKPKETPPSAIAKSPIKLKPFQREDVKKEPLPSPMETVTAEDMMGLEDIDLTNLAMEYSPKEVQSKQFQPQPSVVQHQGVQSPSVMKLQGVQQPSVMQPQSVQQPQQSFQQPQPPSLHSPSLSKPPLKPQQQFQNGMPLRNQAMLQSLQQSGVNRGPNGLPIVRPPMSGVQQALGTVQNNAFSMKRNQPFISFELQGSDPSPHMMPASKR